MHVMHVVVQFIFYVEVRKRSSIIDKYPVTYKEVPRNTLLEIGNNEYFPENNIIRM